MTTISKGMITRRQFALTGLAGAGASLMLPNILRAQSRSLSVVVSAIYKRSFEAFVVPLMRERGVDVAASTMLSAEALARAISQKEAPQISLFTLDQGPWLQGREMGLWSALGEDAVANVAKVPANYRDSSSLGVAMFNYLTGFCYDEQALKAAGVVEPDSFFDMWRSEFAEHVALPQFTNTFAYVTLQHTSRLLGGDVASTFDAGFEKLVKLRPNVRTFIGPLGQLIQLFQQNEIWLAFAPQFTALQASAAGLPVKWRAPQEGAAALSHYIGVPKNAPAQEEAHMLADVLLSPEYQAVLAETDFMVPVVENVPLTDTFRAGFPVTPKISQAALQVDWQPYNAHRVALSERWQREIQH